MTAKDAGACRSGPAAPASPRRVGSRRGLQLRRSVSAAADADGGLAADSRVSGSTGQPRKDLISEAGPLAGMSMQARGPAGPATASGSRSRSTSSMHGYVSRLPLAELRAGGGEDQHQHDPLKRSTSFHGPPRAQGGYDGSEAPAASRAGSARGAFRSGRNGVSQWAGGRRVTNATRGRPPGIGLPSGMVSARASAPGAGGFRSRARTAGTGVGAGVRRVGSSSSLESESGGVPWSWAAPRGMQAVGTGVSRSSGA